MHDIVIYIPRLLQGGGEGGRTHLYTPLAEATAKEDPADSKPKEAEVSPRKEAPGMGVLSLS